MYEKGAFRREIEAVQYDLNAFIDKGERFPFETDLIIETNGGDQTIFDLEVLETYGKAFGIDMFPETDAGSYLIFRKGMPASQPQVQEAVTSAPLQEEQPPKKPWWKFWA
jgi:hypothetical protein